MRCGGIFSVIFITIFCGFQQWKKILKSVNIWWSYWYINIFCHFWPTLCKSIYTQYMSKTNSIQCNIKCYTNAPHKKVTPYSTTSIKCHTYGLTILTFDINCSQFKCVQLLVYLIAFSHVPKKVSLFGPPYKHAHQKNAHLLNTKTNMASLHTISHLIKHARLTIQNLYPGRFYSRRWKNVHLHGVSENFTPLKFFKHYFSKIKNF